jgi:hypothetical protein
VTPTAVNRYLGAERLGAKAWETMSRGLVALGLDPRRVRPNAPLSLPARDAPEDLRPLLDGFRRRQLEAMLRVLEAPPEAQYVLKVVIRDRLERDKDLK